MSEQMMQITVEVPERLVKRSVRAVDASQEKVGAAPKSLDEIVAMGLATVVVVQEAFVASGPIRMSRRTVKLVGQVLRGER